MLKSIAIAAALFASFIYGMAVIKFKVFPYSLLHAMRVHVAPTVDYYSYRANFFRTFPGAAEVVMLGDSHTERPDWSAVFPDVRIVNQGIAGDTASGALARVDAVEASGAKTVFIMLGTNDLLSAEPGDAFRHYEGLIDALHKAGIAIFVQSAPPTTDLGTNKKIAVLNTLLKGYCQTHCTFIDLNGTLAPNGTLLPAYSLDGTHLTVEGYRVWADQIRPFLPAPESLP